MAMIYVVFMMTLFFCMLYILLFVYLLLKKALTNRLNVKRRAYTLVVQPKIIGYVTKGTPIYRLLNTSSPWKRKVIIDNLLNMASIVSHEDELRRIHHLCQQIGLDKQLEQLIQSDKWWIASGATRQAGGLKLQSLAPYINHNLSASHFDLWFASARALTQMNQGINVARYLVDHEQELDRTAILRLGDMLLAAEAQILPFMIKHLDTVSMPLKLVFIDILGKRKAIAALDQIEALIVHENSELRIKALKAIADIGHTTKEHEVMRRLEAGEWPERLMCIRIIQECRLRRGVPQLAELLCHTKWWIRLRAAEALLSFGVLGVERLRWISMHHEDRYARDMASKILAEHQLGGAAA